MNTIRLGVGDDAVEVEDGARVPMKARDWNRDDRLWATVRLVDDIPVLKFGASVFNVQVDDGTTSHRDGWHIDLAALRRERAPKAAGAWTDFLPQSVPGGEAVLSVAKRTAPGAWYWTTRPGNTPEKQAAFDAAMSVWADDWRRRMEKPGSGVAPPIEMALWSAAHDLGYGGGK